MWVFSFSPISASSRARATCSIKSPSQSQFPPPSSSFYPQKPTRGITTPTPAGDLDPQDLSDDVGRSEVNAFGHVVGFDVQLALQVTIYSSGLSLNDWEVLNNMSTTYKIISKSSKGSPSMLEFGPH